MTKRIDAYRDRALEDLAAYSIAHAAQLVRLSPSTLRAWACGSRDHKPRFKLAVRRPPMLSFANLVEAYILASMRRVDAVPMQRVRKALGYVAKDLGISRPLIHASFQTDGANLFVKHAERVLNVSADGQAVLREVLEASLARIQWEHDLAAALYLPVRDGDLRSQHRSIVVNPRLGFGKPVIAGTGIEGRPVLAHAADDLPAVLKSASAARLTS